MKKLGIMVVLFTGLTFLCTAMVWGGPVVDRILKRQKLVVGTSANQPPLTAKNKKGEIIIKTTFRRKTRKVKIEIADSGHGVPSDDKAKLFLPHFSTKKKGTGLGLTIVNKIISDHNGSTEVEDNKPNGTKFIIQLPA